MLGESVNSNYLTVRFGISIIMSKTVLLFKSLRNHKWDDVRELLSGANIDLNVKNRYGDCALSYAVKFNRPDMVSLLITNGARYDSTDRDERPVLCEAVKYGYEQIVEILLNASDNGVGMPVVNIADKNGLTPIHYAIKSNNINLIKTLVEKGSDLYRANNSGLNAFHMATKHGAEEMVRVLIKESAKSQRSGKSERILDTRTANGETALFIAVKRQSEEIVSTLLKEGADPNTPEKDRDLTPTHIAAKLNNCEILSLLLENGACPDRQDRWGDVALMSAIRNKSIPCFNEIINHSPNLRLWNNNGETPLHEALSSYASNSAVSSFFTDALISESGVSIQNSEGNSCLHYLIRLGIWKEYRNILSTKRMNIFAKNTNGERAIDLCEKDDINDLIDLTTVSYLNLLRTDTEWNDELDRICSSDKITETDKKRLMELGGGDPRVACSNLIKERLIRGMESSAVVSYPVSRKVVIGGQPDVGFCTFTGSFIDIFTGLTYLLSKHRNTGSVISTAGSGADNLSHLYKRIGYQSDCICGFIGFEMVWADCKLYVVNDFPKLLTDCVDRKKFVIFPLAIELRTGAHANYLIYDTELKELERFEPHGGLPGKYFGSDDLDNSIVELFTGIIDDIKYFQPSSYLPKMGFQVSDTSEVWCHRIGDPKGFCALWCVWYVDMRLTYPLYSRSTLVTLLREEVSSRGLTFRDVIRNYSKEITVKRDRILRKVGLDINNWLNSSYTSSQIKTLFSLLRKELINAFR